jgi:hypothetical protein
MIHTERALESPIREQANAAAAAVPRKREKVIAIGGRSYVAHENSGIHATAVISHGQ